ncbi:MAG: response regulator [Thaumarchaeota archaeon]|nr:MAG: response regulator [Nitrososphaerota archaeon]
MPARLLVVDDERDICTVLSQSLKNAGYEVDSFTDPEEALSKFTSGRYALTLLNIKMPRINGFDVFEKLQAIDKNIKVCFLTAFDRDFRDEMNSRFPRIQLRCFLHKPISLQKVVQAINEELKTEDT